MEKTNFESLRIYALAEQLADEIWSIALRWPEFARATQLESKSCARLTALAPISPKAVEKAAQQIIAVFCVSRVARFMKLNTGCVAPSNAVC